MLQGDCLYVPLSYAIPRTDSLQLCEICLCLPYQFNGTPLLQTSPIKVISIKALKTASHAKVRLKLHLPHKKISVRIVLLKQTFGSEKVCCSSVMHCLLLGKNSWPYFISMDRHASVHFLEVGCFRDIIKEISASLNLLLVFFCISHW